MIFSQLQLDRQLSEIFDELTELETSSLGDLSVYQGEISNVTVAVVGFDFSASGGSVGPCEAEQIRTAIAFAREKTLPLVFILNTGGVRVTEGAESLAAFRVMYRDLVDGKLDGLRVISLVAQHCFGGGSMLAAVSDRVLVSSCSQVSMSGPKLIREMSLHEGQLPPTYEDVRSLLGGHGRALISDRFQMIDDRAKAYKGHLGQLLLLSQSSDLRLEPNFAALRRRITKSDGMNSEPVNTQSVAHSLVDASRIGVHDFQVWDSGLFSSNALCNSGVGIYGIVNTRFANADIIFDLINAIKNSPSYISDIKIFIDCSSHSPSLSSEAVIMSEYLSTLTRCLRKKYRDGVEIHVVIIGSAGGGVFAALSAGASRLSALSGASIHVLPAAALSTMGWSYNASLNSSDLLHSGAVDDVIDDISTVIG